jgi:hypothetical protein
MPAQFDPNTLNEKSPRVRSAGDDADESATFHGLISARAERTPQ